jgi:hypothetical protein
MKIELCLDIKDSSYLKCSLHLSETPDTFVTKSLYNLQNESCMSYED